MADQPTFYFDFNSPYAYLAAARIDELIPDAAWRPIAYPFVLGKQGRLEASLKRDFEAVRTEVSERAAGRGLPPLNPPPGWPIESWSLQPLRAAVFAGERGRVREFSGAAFRKVFVEGRSLTVPENLRDAAREAGLDPDEVDEAIEQPDVKQRLKDQTDEALAKGLPGIPTVAMGDELFWGDDHLEEAAAAVRQ